MVQFLKFQSVAIKRILKITDNSGHELFIVKILLIAIDWNFFKPPYGMAIKSVSLDLL